MADEKIITLEHSDPRLRIVEQTYENTAVQIDEIHFIRCKFVKCTLVFGGGFVNLDACDLVECNFGFSGAAGSTIGFLKFLASNPDTRNVVDDIFQAIRGG